MYPARVTPIGALSMLSPSQPKWRGVLLAGNCPSGVHYMTERLLDRGYQQFESPRSLTLSPSFTVIDNRKLWNHGMYFHRVYVAGADEITWDHVVWAHSMVEAGNREDTERLLSDLGYLLKE